MTPENEAKKQYLLRYRQAERDVQLLMEEKERLLALATKVTPSYSGEAKGSGSGSRVESAAEKIIQCEEEINRAIDCAVDLRSEIKGAIATVPDWKLREILTRRYILGQKWEQVAWEMSMEFRWVLRLHGMAIAELTIVDHV